MLASFLHLLQRVLRSADVERRPEKRAQDVLEFLGLPRT